MMCRPTTCAAVLLAGLPLLASLMPARAALATDEPQAIVPPDSESEPQYFEEERVWEFGWGTDTAFTLSNLKNGSTNETNDHTTPFDGLWLRLYGRLSYGKRAELVVDLYSAELSTPSFYGLYAKLDLNRHLGLRVGLLPLVFGGWQDRAYPSRQPLIGAPLLAQYLLNVRAGSVPANPSDLVTRRGPERGDPSRYGAIPGIWAATAYERCWDTGVEVFGEAGRLRYRLAAMEGTPGASASHSRLNKSGGSLEGRLTYHFSDRVRLGASASSGSYLLDSVDSDLPVGAQVGDYRQDLLGGDLKLAEGPLEVNAEYAFSRFGTPFSEAGSWGRSANLDTHAYFAELAVTVAPGLRLAGRISGLAFGSIDDGLGGRPRWDANATRVEAGAVYRFWEDHLAVKAAFQRTAVAAEPRRVENLAALQLSVSH